MKINVAVSLGQLTDPTTGLGKQSGRSGSEKCVRDPAHLNRLGAPG